MPFVDRTPDFTECIREASGRINSKELKADIGLDYARSEFQENAVFVSRAIHDTTRKLQELGKLVKARNVFKDNSGDINQLTYTIKMDIQQLNSRLDAMQSYIQSGNGRKGKQEVSHSNHVIGQLQTRLMSTTKEFKHVLQERTDTLKDQQKRRSNFGLGKPTTLGKPLIYKSTPASSSIPSVSSDLPRPSGVLAASILTTSTSSSIPSSLPYSEPSFTSPLALQSTQQLVSNSNYLEDRVNAVSDIESHIVELGQIFNKLGSMVAEHDDMIIRLDDNVQDALSNVTNSEQQLRRYLASLSSNRVLLAKIMMVLMFFALFYVVVIA